MDIDPWTIYWQADQLDSCIAGSSAEDAQQIAAFWHRFAAELASGAQVLDLATGNGTVPRALLDANADLAVTGVDKADIDPMQYLSSPGWLDKVTFLGGVDVCELPFDENSFDAVTSQYGIEYAPLDKAVPEACRVLKQGGRINLLVHHEMSEVVVPAKSRLTEMQNLLKPGGVIERLEQVIKSSTGMAELDEAGKEYLAADFNRSAGVSGQVFTGVNRIISALRNDDVATARELGTAMVVRLRADRDRLSQMVDAAVSETDIQAIEEQFRAAGFDVDQLSPFILQADTAEAALIGWQIQCTKK